ncbi:hypothetical protein ACJX0J_006440, partial [Zea mays]
MLHLLSGITELDDRKQRKLCLKKFRSRDEHLSEVDTKRELECGLCMRCFEYWLCTVFFLFADAFLGKGIFCDDSDEDEDSDQ